MRPPKGIAAEVCLDFIARTRDIGFGLVSTLGTVLEEDAASNRGTAVDGLGRRLLDAAGVFGGRTDLRPASDRCSSSSSGSRCLFPSAAATDGFGVAGKGVSGDVGMCEPGESGVLRGVDGMKLSLGGSSSAGDVGCDSGEDGGGMSLENAIVGCDDTIASTVGPGGGSGGAGLATGVAIITSSAVSCAVTGTSWIASIDDTVVIRSLSPGVRHGDGGILLKSRCGIGVAVSGGTERARGSLTGVNSVLGDGAEDDDEGFLDVPETCAVDCVLSFSPSESPCFARFNSRSLSATVSRSGDDGRFAGTS